MRCDISWTRISELLGNKEMDMLLAACTKNMQDYHGRVSGIQTVVGRVLLAFELRSRINWNEMIREMQYSETGKPFLRSNQNFSISHAGDYVAVAVSDNGEVGLDIEDGNKDLGKLNHWFCHPNETKTIESSKDSKKELVKTWTRKEAMSKLSGRGWGMGYSAVNVSEGKVQYGKESFYLRTEALDDNLILTVATYDVLDDWTVDRLDVNKLVNYFSGQLK